MSFIFGGRIFCDLTIGQLFATRGLGVYRLQISINLSVKEIAAEESLPGPVLTELVGDLKFKGQPLCQIHPLSPENLRKTKNSNTAKIDLYADLSRTQIEAIELHRVGEIQFDLRLFGKIVRPILIQNSRVAPYVELESEIVAEDLAVRVSQSAWIELLDRWNYTETLLFELALSKTASSNLSDALHHFKQAQSALTRGDFKGVVRDCRCAIDSVSEKIETLEERRVGMMKLLEDKRDRTKEERFLLLRKSLSHLCDPSHHGDPTSSSIDWTRDDALQIQTVTAALLAKAFAMMPETDK